MIPMPSPTGRNRSRLFVRGPCARVLAAYDARSGLLPTHRARDQEDEPDEVVARIKTFLKNRLSPEDYQRLEQMLSGEEGSQEDYQDEEDDRGDDDEANGVRRWRERVGGEAYPQGRDMPPPDGPSLLPGGRGALAHDARGPRSYFDDFPGNARVGLGYGD